MRTDGVGVCEDNWEDVFRDVELYAASCITVVLMLYFELVILSEFQVAKDVQQCQERSERNALKGSC